MRDTSARNGWDSTGSEDNRGNGGSTPTVMKSDIDHDLGMLDAFIDNQPDNIDINMSCVAPNSRRNCVISSCSKTSLSERACLQAALSSKAFRPVGSPGMEAVGIVFCKGYYRKAIDAWSSRRQPRGEKCPSLRVH